MEKEGGRHAGKENERWEWQRALFLLCLKHGENLKAEKKIRCPLSKGSQGVETVHSGTRFS